MVNVVDVFTSDVKGLMDEFYRDIDVSRLESYNEADLIEDATSAHNRGCSVDKYSLIFTDSSNTVGYLYRWDDFVLIDKFHWLGLDRFKPVLSYQLNKLVERDIDNTKNLKGAYYGKYTSQRLRLKMDTDYVSLCPVVDGLSKDELDDIYFTFTVSNITKKQQLGNGVKTNRNQQRIFDRNMMAAPLICAVYDSNNKLDADLSKYEGRVQVHHVDCDNGNDDPNNLVMVVDVLHNLVETDTKNLKARDVYAIANALRDLDDLGLQKILGNYGEFMRWMKLSCGVILADRLFKNVNKINDWFNRFIENEGNNVKYNCNDDIWDLSNLTLVESLQTTASNSKAKQKGKK